MFGEGEIRLVDFIIHILLKFHISVCLSLTEFMKYEGCCTRKKSISIIIDYQIIYGLSMDYSASITDLITIMISITKL